MTAAEAFLLQIAKRGLDGYGAAARAAMAVIEQAHVGRAQQPPDLPGRFVIHWVRPGAVTRALEILRMAKKLDRYRKTARMALEPWIVEAALARLDDRHLTTHEQQIVVDACRTSKKVRWPDWWEVKP